MEKQQGNGLIYGLNDKPPFKEAFFAALQHLLAIFVAIITPPLIIAGALKLDAETTGYLVSMALFASGISTFCSLRLMTAPRTAVIMEISTNRIRNALAERAGLNMTSSGGTTVMMY